MVACFVATWTDWPIKVGELTLTGSSWIEKAVKMKNEKKQIRQQVGILLLLALFSVLPLKAQYADEEYRVELGGRLGGMAYMGDANYTDPLKNLGLSAGVVARYNFNPRMALKGDILMGKISGDTRTMENVFPDGQQVSFEHTIYDIALQFEYNFWPYGNGLTYRESRRFTPYMATGMGLTLAPKTVESVTAVTFSLAAGVKYKFAPRWNVGLEFSMRFSTSDGLDVVSTDGLVLDDPYLVESGFMKNKDSYSMIGVTVTYDLWPKCDNCNRN